ncbi:hypothetical protein F5B20DRAFT_565604 [Whalleya microplaca]|nr:hypothetical protein F5B20DRAFT_565604 [Whalleya microplaca]
MSLNGLDDAKVIEAYEAATLEPGGWFLLKYTSRDEVELLGRGNGGIVDIRSAIAKFEETSPLYGLLKYRRRNVILKYMPEECSRLVQARAAVHFNVICERFTPHDTTFEISAAKDLKDSKLSAACSLHAASGSSSSSSSSLRRRRLNEIAEEEEEEERERKRQSTVKEEGRTASLYSDTGRPPSASEPPVVLDRQQITHPQDTNFASTDNVPDFTGVDRPTSPTKSETARRISSQLTRPELYSFSTYTYGKPKVKLGPRPSLEANKRPVTATGNFRPTAALPVGFKFFSKGPKKGKPQELEQAEKKGGERGHDTKEVATHTTPVPIPEVPSESGLHLHLPPRPATSSGASVKTMPATMTVSAKDKITPEKARLMKAMKLRERKKMMSAAAPEPSPTPEGPPLSGEEKGGKPGSVQDDGNRSTFHADSGVAIDPPTPMTINTEARSEGTVSDSHPNSPTAASSSGIGVSTKASSLSESTDETLQETRGSNANALREEPDKLLDVMQEAGLRMSPVEPPLENALEPVKAPSSETPETKVSDVTAVKAAEESHEIPEPDHQQTSIEVGSEEQKSPLEIPTSKFSSNEAKTEASPTSPSTPGLKSKFSTQEVTLPATPSVVPPPEEGNKTSKAGPDVGLPPPKSARRKTLGQPLKTQFITRTTEENDPLDDDALMDELQEATLQEAKPMLVSKSPITPVFPESGPLKPAPHLTRSVTNPMRGPLHVAGDVSQSSARSVSAGGAAYLHTVTRQQSNAGLQSKKNNIGSSISQRIKALEKLTGTPGGEDVRPRTATPSSTFFTVRRQSIRDPSTPVTEKPDLTTRKTPTPEHSREGTPDTSSGGRERKRERSASVASRLTMFEGQPQSATRGRPESIQVTARIIRSPSQSLKRSDTTKNPSEYHQVEFRQSPLFVDVQRADPTDQAPSPAVEINNDSLQERRKSVSEDREKKNRRSSLSIVKDFIKDRRTSVTSRSTDNLAAMSPGSNPIKSPSRPPSAHQNTGGFVRRLSISSRRSSFSREREGAGSTPGAMSPSILSDSGSGDDRSMKDSEKKSKNRASRFMRRLSNSFSGRKNTSATISPTVTEEDADQLAAASKPETQPSSQPAVVAYMGDVNVQFPDNLLWKRRSMCLDSQGFLFLSAVQGAALNAKDKSGVKRYHLGDFRKPYIPDVEIQELPNSVVLDLLDGSSLQIACEDRAGQMNILHTLQDSHQSHSSYGQ